MATIQRCVKSATGTTAFGASTKAKSSEVNYDFNTVYTLVNGNIDNDNIKDGAAIEATKLNLGTIAQNVAFTGTVSGVGILDMMYPVGIVVTLGVSTNPATLFGVGTWTAIAGKVIIGIDATQTEFDTLNETGGAKTVTLDATTIPSHSHDLEVMTAESGATARTWGYSNSSRTVGMASGRIGATGGGLAHENMPPYICKFVWERVS